LFIYLFFFVYWLSFIFFNPSDWERFAYTEYERLSIEDDDGDEQLHGVGGVGGAGGFVGDGEGEY
jgi:hypothetical protein